VREFAQLRANQQKAQRLIDQRARIGQRLPVVGQLR
jgi:hypothetical protein